MIGTPNGGRSVDENTYKSLRAGKVASKNKNYSFYYNAPTLIIVLVSPIIRMLWRIPLVL